MDQEPLVSVLIPAYNMADTLGQAVESLLAQDYPRFEAIIIDDGSTDQTAQVARRYLPGGPHADGRVSLISQANGGKPAALNAGLARARGQLVAILDADDVWPPASLSLRVAALQARPDAVAVYADANYMDFEGNIYRTRRSRPFRTMGQLIASVICPVIGASLMARMAVLRDIGPLDPSFTRSDDAYLNAEVFRRGKMIHQPGVVLNYRNYPRPENIRLRLLSWRCDLRLARRHFRGPARWYYLAKLTLVMLLKVGYELVTAKK